MPFGCCVPHCNANMRNGPKASMFSFPNDRTLFQKWIKAIHRKDFRPSPTSKVCERHFQPQDVERTSSMYDIKKGKLLTAPLFRPRLRKGAVPTKLVGCSLYLSTSFQKKFNPENPEERRQRLDDSSGIDIGQTKVFRGDEKEEKAVIVKQEIDHFLSGEIDIDDSCYQAAKLPDGCPQDAAMTKMEIKVEGDFGTGLIEEISNKKVGRGSSNQQALCEPTLEECSSMCDDDVHIQSGESCSASTSTSTELLLEFVDCRNTDGFNARGSAKHHYNCSYCNRVYSNQNQLKIHMRKHTGERPFQRTVCTKGFSDESSLIDHLEFHNIEEPSQFTICNKLSLKTSNRHLRTPTDKKTFQRTFCRNLYSQKSKLNWSKLNVSKNVL